MGDNNLNGGGAFGGGDTPECALDGLFHEAEADWEPENYEV